MKLENGMAAVVTGGASGLGRASAEALAAQGLKVAIFDMNEETGAAVAAQIGGLVMEGLKGLDDVAYVRFASVYRNFREAKDFENIIGELSQDEK